MEIGRRQCMPVSEKAISRYLPIGNIIFSRVTTVKGSNKIFLEYKPNILY
jgi:hypothetical protein